MQELCVHMDTSAIICGDSIAYLKTLADDSVDAVITDPPYGLEEFCMARGHRMATMGRANHIDDGWDKSSVITEVVNEMLVEASRVLKPGGNLLMFGAFEPLGQYATNPPGKLYYKTFGVWHKSNPIPRNMNVRYVSALETWIHFVNAKKGKKTGTFNNEGKPQHNYVKTSLTPVSERKHGRHSTQKPLSVMNYFVELLTNPGDIVVDPFAGSGSTIVSAESLGRIGIGIELDSTYADIASKRLADAKAGNAKQQDSLLSLGSSSLSSDNEKNEQ